MNLFAPPGLLLTLLAFQTAASAAVTTNFNSLASNGQVAPNEGWSINEPTVDLSFVVDGAAGNKFGALGGFLSDPVAVLPGINLTHSANTQIAAGSTFSASYALINRSTLPAPDNFPSSDPDDWFGFSVGDGADVFSISFRPTTPANESSRQVFHNGTAVAGVGIGTSDYANPLFSTVTVSFTNVAGVLNYTGSVSTSGAPILFNGVIPGKGTTTFTTVGIDWDVKNNPAGFNFILVDNLSIVPEPSISLMGILSLGLLTSRRRR